jgi:7-cyano-7-deazaguanine synthase in queuosine biosynthesis
MSLVYARRGGGDTGGTDAILDSTKNLLTGENKFKSEYGSLTSLESDLLLLAAAVYSTDRCMKRGEREDSPRDIQLSVPAVNIGVLQPEIHRIEQILRKLSSDSWTVMLRQVNGTVEKPNTQNTTSGKTLLFSGGLDSLAAAIDLGLAGEHLQLVSHITHNQPTAAAQEELVEMMRSTLKLSFPHRRFLVSAKSTNPSPNLTFDAESSQRTRSFLFLTLAALCARRVGHQNIVVIAENGQMAVHLPATEGRIGPFSTRTAHPEILQLMEQFLSSVLGISIKIDNPYLNRTKAEVILPVIQRLPAAVPLAVSCWKNARLSAGATHCGFCIPCIIRRIAIETHITDTTAYARDLFGENLSIAAVDDDDGRRNLIDYGLFARTILDTPSSEASITWPELISPCISVADTMAMYIRAATEAQTVFAKYSSLGPLLT